MSHLSGPQAVSSGSSWRGYSMGPSIVQTLVKDKLRGNLEIESGPEGTCARFDFKNQIIGTADVT